MSKESLRRALQGIDLVISDTDGVLSRGITLVEEGRKIQTFCEKDPPKIGAVVEAGIQFVMISGFDCGAARSRAGYLHVPFHSRAELSADGGNPLEFLEKLYLVRRRNILYVGDDWQDLWWMNQVGVSAVPADAEEMCRLRANIVATRRGGEGAVADILTELLAAKGLLYSLTRHYINDPPK